MVFASGTCCPAADGQSAAGTVEEVVVTADGSARLTLFPAEELFVTNANLPPPAPKERHNHVRID
jgi:hypothetical protein